MTTNPTSGAETSLRSLEIFSGAGGMALGIAQAGFSHLALVDLDNAACKTLQKNREAGFDLLQGSEIINDDIARVNLSRYREKVDLLAGGPPCQPFSVGGKRAGHRDGRNMFPEAINVVRDLRPRCFIFENVRGILRSSFANYLEYIRLQLRFPSEGRLHGERWTQHHGRLERMFTKGVKEEYRVLIKLLNAADYGTPQRRERVFMVGIRADNNVEWQFPPPTHSEAALLKTKWLTNEYWERHGVSRKARKHLSIHAEERIRRLLEKESNNLAPWRTVRDAIHDLPNPRKTNEMPNHNFISGARSYHGHTGSPWDDPAKTIKAGDHGVPGGENMLLNVNGSVRYFTIRELARLQTFPDNFEFHGPWGSLIKQIGNAVPTVLAQVLGKSLLSVLGGVNGHS